MNSKIKNVIGIILASVSAAVVTASSVFAKGGGRQGRQGSQGYSRGQGGQSGDYGQW